MGYNIAIDGPASAGKSTIAKQVAKKLGYIYVDTGAMYRAMALHFINHNIKEEDYPSIVNACKDAKITIVYENNLQQVYLNNTNVTEALRQENVGIMASKCSSIPEVRNHLLELQRELARSNNVVMDGRDIGTTILPNANLKIFLTASIEARAGRRYKELLEKGVDCKLEAIKHDIEERDLRDKTRAIAPLKKAPDAILIDSSDKNIEEVAAVILGACVWK
ncbi:MAG: (d)CMP kinase [Lachnospiraceae bacterium]